MVHVFAKKNTSRLRYVLDFCFKDKGMDYTLITDPLKWKGSEGFCINYSDDEMVANKKIVPTEILFETGWEKSYAITFNKEWELNGVADTLGIIFHLLTRYKEYSNSEWDTHGRFLSKNHELASDRRYRVPVADKLVKEIWEELNLDYSIIQNRFELVPSFDIDVAWAYKHRKPWRQLGAMARGKKIGERIKVLLGKERDPFDTYTEIHLISAAVKRVICFALLGDRGKYDKNIHHTNFALGSTIRGLNAQGGMGIHPSYNSYGNVECIIKERKRLEEIVGHEVVKSRQHFLKLRIPETYETLLKAGITREYSMGFFDDLGFRAGTSFPFYFYNLNSEKKENLLIFPFVYMDGTLRQYMKLSPEDSLPLIEESMNHVKEVGGVYMPIWHNSSINDLGEWKGWKLVLDKTVEWGRVNTED